MTKMSPALIFFAWTAQKEWKPAWICGLSCVLLSVMVIPWVSFQDQMHFYTEILPEFSSGAYHGLKIPMIYLLIIRFQICTIKFFLVPLKLYYQKVRNAYRA